MGVISNGTTLLDAGAIDSGVESGVMTHIKTLTASSSATLSFVDGASSVVLDNTYKEYVFKFYNIHPATNNADLGLLASIDTGSNYGVATTSSFFESGHSEDDNNTKLTYITSFDAAQSTGLIKMTGSVDDDNDSSTSGTLHLFDPSSTTFVKHFMTESVGDSTPDYVYNIRTAGYCNTTSAVNAVDFKMSSGNIDSGIIKMYGIA